MREPIPGLLVQCSLAPSLFIRCPWPGCLWPHNSRSLARALSAGAPAEPGLGRCLKLRWVLWQLTGHLSWDQRSSRPRRRQPTLLPKASGPSLPWLIFTFHKDVFLRAPGAEHCLMGTTCLAHSGRFGSCQAGCKHLAFPEPAAFLVRHHKR